MCRTWREGARVWRRTHRRCHGSPAVTPTTTRPLPTHLFFFPSRLLLQYYKDAIIFYSDGLEQKPNNKELVSILYSNRAHVQILLQNYGHAAQDAYMAAMNNPKNVKVGQ